MIEPPQPGFTNVVWEAREPERLTRELSTGPGAIPMAEAGATWARLAAGFGAAVVEYEQVVAALGGAWESDTSRSVVDKISRLRDWLIEAAKAAGENAIRAEKQAAAYQLARLTMPNALDIAAIQEAQRALEQIGVALGAPIKAVAAQTDAQDDLAKAAASRVMRSYEMATEPLANPWPHEQPPVIASAAALEAEQASAIETQSASATMAAGLPGVGLPGLSALMSAPRPLSAYRGTAVQAAPEVTETVVPQPVPAVNPAASAGLPFAPLSALGAPGVGQGEEEHTPRAGLIESDAIGQDLGIVSAPAVLGAVDSAAPAAPVSAPVPPNQVTTGGVA